MGNRARLVFGKLKTTACLVDSERLSHPARPHLHPAIGKHLQLHSVRSQRLQLGRQLIHGPIGPENKHIRPDQLPLGGVPLVRWARGQWPGGGFRIVHRLELRRFLPDPCHHRLPELLGPHLLLGDPFAENIVGVHPVLDCLEPGVVHFFRHVGLPDMNQHLHRPQKQPGRIRQVLTGPTRGRSVDRLKHRAAVPDVGRAGQTDRACDLRSHVGKNVPVQVGHDDDVKHLGRVGQLRRADIHDPVLLLDVCVLGADLIKHLVKETVGHLHDVVLGKAGHLLATVGPCILERIPHDLLAARTRNQLETLGNVVGAPVLNTRVGVFLILAHDDHIHLGMLRPDERIVAQAWTNVRIQAERLAGGDIQGFKTSALRSGDRGLQKDFCPPQRLPSRRFDACRISP